MGLWDKLFGKKYLSWEEYQEKMFELEEEIWQRKAALRPAKKLDLPPLKK